MKQIVLYMAIQGLFICSINAQDIATQIPMDAEHWTSTQGEVEFTQHKSIDAMKILSRQEFMVARDVVFKDGTIEFDVAVENTSFPLPLRPGENELLIGIVGNFWSWGIIARLDKNQGITISR